jgi:hypothetical protein
VHSGHGLRIACLRCFDLYLVFLTAMNHESPSMEILDQMHWSPGRIWKACESLSVDWFGKPSGTLKPSLWIHIPRSG